MSYEENKLEQIMGGYGQEFQPANSNQQDENPERPFHPSYCECEDCKKYILQLTDYLNRKIAKPEEKKHKEGDEFYPGQKHQRLFNWLHDKNFIALHSEMEEIMKIVHESFPHEYAAQLKEEVEQLKAWKEDSISVTPDMQAIGRLLGVKLGHSIHDKIIPGIEGLKEENQRLREALEKIKAAAEKFYTENKSFDPAEDEIYKLVSEALSK